jgi:hypothetical protein
MTMKQYKINIDRLLRETSLGLMYQGTAELKMLNKVKFATTTNYWLC